MKLISAVIKRMQANLIWVFEWLDENGRQKISRINRDTYHTEKGCSPRKFNLKTHLTWFFLCSSTLLSTSHTQPITYSIITFLPTYICSTALSQLTLDIALTPPPQSYSHLHSMISREEQNIYFLPLVQYIYNNFLLNKIWILKIMKSTLITL